MLSTERNSPRLKRSYILWVLFRINDRIFNVLVDGIFSGHPAFIRMQNNQLTEDCGVFLNIMFYLIVVSQDEIEQIIA